METLTTQTMKLNEVTPPGFTAPGKSLINEVEKLKDAVLLLCDLQRELTKKVDEALSRHTDAMQRGVGDDGALNC